MARSSSTPSTQSAVDESQAAQADDQTQTQVESTHKADQVPPPPLSLSSIMPIIALVVRIITLVSLILSISLIASNSTSIRIDTTGLVDSNSTSIRIRDEFVDDVITVQFKFNDIYAYRYALATAVIGMTYTLLQLAFSIYQVMSGKRLTINHVKVYDFVGDKVILSLVATGVGAIFGATLDLKNNIDKVEDAVELYLDTTLDPFISKLDDFFSRAYIPAIFLLIAFITCGISSILSSLALNKKTQ